MTPYIKRKLLKYSKTVYKQALLIEMCIKTDIFTIWEFRNKKNENFLYTKARKSDIIYTLAYEHPTLGWIIVRG